MAGTAYAVTELPVLFLRFAYWIIAVSWLTGVVGVGCSAIQNVDASSATYYIGGYAVLTQLISGFGGLSAGFIAFVVIILAQSQPASGPKLRNFLTSPAPYAIYFVGILAPIAALTTTLYGTIIAGTILALSAWPMFDLGRRINNLVTQGLATSRYGDGWDFGPKLTTEEQFANLHHGRWPWPRSINLSGEADAFARRLRALAECMGYIQAVGSIAAGAIVVAVARWSLADGATHPLRSGALSAVLLPAIAVLTASLHRDKYKDLATLYEERALEIRTPRHPTRYPSHSCANVTQVR